MEFKKEDAIKLSEVAKLIIEINNDTENFRKQCLECVKMPEIKIEKPQSFTLSYINGKYIVGIKPYCTFTLDENENVKEYKQKGNDLDSQIAHQFLEKNYEFLRTILVYLQSLPPTYYVGYSDKKGYMSIDYNENDTLFRITNSTIEFNQQASNTRIQYNILEENIISCILGTNCIFKKDDNTYQEILSKILNNEIPKQILPEVIKTKIDKLSMERETPENPLKNKHK